MAIYTHMNPDLDAKASVWAVRLLASLGVLKGIDTSEVKLVPAHWSGEGLTERDIAVDIPAGGRGIKGEKLPGGKVLSCFVSLLMRAPEEVKDAISPLAEYIDRQGSSADAVYEILRARQFGIMDSTLNWNAISRHDVPAALRVASLDSILKAFDLTAGSPEKSIEMASAIFDALYTALSSRSRAKQEVASARHFGPVALIENAKERATNAILFERGAKVVVYSDGHNFGVVRGDERVPHLETLVRPLVEKYASSEVKEWFFHSEGFLACRGSRKAPQTTPSRLYAIREKFAQDLANAITAAMEEEKGERNGSGEPRRGPAARLSQS